MQHSCRAMPARLSWRVLDHAQPGKPPGISRRPDAPIITIFPHVGNKNPAVEAAEWVDW